MTSCKLLKYSLINSHALESWSSAILIEVANPMDSEFASLELVSFILRDAAGAICYSFYILELHVILWEMLS